jgi:Domain of unknown function DUF29
MEELFALREMVEHHNYEAALALINEMEEMAKDDKIVKINSYLVILLIHLIKQNAEKRTTSSWSRSINHSLDGIAASNKRRKAGGQYLTVDELKESIEEVFKKSVKEAAEEAFGGAFSAKQLADMIDTDAIKQEALDLILNYED